MVSSILVSPERDGRDEANEDSTPPTRSYIDALLQGNLSEAELANLRAEIGKAEQSALESAADDEDGVRTLFHAYTAAERLSSRPSGAMPQVNPMEALPPTVPPPPGAPDPSACLEDDDAPTLFRPSSVPLPRPISEPAPRPLSQPVPSSRPRLPPSAYPRIPPNAVPHVPPSSDPGFRGFPRSSHPGPPSSERGLRAFARSSHPAPPSSEPGYHAFARASHAAPSSERSWGPPSSRPLVDLGDLLSDDFPEAPPMTPVPARAHVHEEVPLSVPSLRGADQRAIDDSYLQAIGGPASVPRIAVSPGELRCLPLGAQAGFLVSCIDGTCTVDDLIDISGLSRLDTLRILYDLLQHGAIEVG